MQNWQLIKNHSEGQFTVDNDSLFTVTPEGIVLPKNIIADSEFANNAHPKLNFNFTLDVEFRDSIFGDTISVWGHPDLKEINIPVKTATRPNPTVTYADVNYYNYRTKVATKVEYGTTTITFYDDGNNAVHDFYQKYMEAISPAARMGLDSSLADNPFASPFGASSSLGALNSPSGVIRSLNLNHYYHNGAKWYKTTYSYINPKIQSFNLDELDMTKSDTNNISMEFVPDAVTVRTEVSDKYTVEASENA